MNFNETKKGMILERLNPKTGKWQRGFITDTSNGDTEGWAWPWCWILWCGDKESTHYTSEEFNDQSGMWRLLGDWESFGNTLSSQF